MYSKVKPCDDVHTCSSVVLQTVLLTIITLNVKIRTLQFMIKKLIIP